MKERLIGYAKNKKISIPAALGLVVLLIIVFSLGGGNASYETRAAAIRTVAQEVNVTGNVKSAQALDLAFEKGGRVASVAVKVGDIVEEGHTLASLSNADLSAQLQSNLAGLEREQVKLSELMRGARNEKAAVSTANVEGARTELGNARISLVDQVNNAFSKADDAVRNYADTLFENSDTSPSFGVTVSSGGTTYLVDTSDTSLSVSINQKRRDAEKILDSWSFVAQSIGDETLAVDARKAEADLVAIQSLLNDVALAVNTLYSEDATTNSVYAGFKADISTARTSLNSALASLRSAIQTYNTKKSVLEVAQLENTLTTAPATSEEIAIQEAAIRAAQAQVDASRAEISKTKIVAPLSGTVTAVDARVGEIASAYSPVISIISEDELQIEMYVPEADIAKVKRGAKASVTFDAYGSDFETSATVVSIDPAETEIDGVPTYRVILAFDDRDDRIKSGLTADVDIYGEEREGVVAIPQRAIVVRDGERFVRVLEGDVVIERQVSTGLRGSDGMVEVLRGVSEGELVVISMDEK